MAEPIYRKIRDQIIDQIKSESLPPNTLFLTEREAEQRFGVSRITIRHALDLLEREGYIYRVRGRGTFVAPHEAQPVKTVAMLATCILRNGVETVLLRAIEQYFERMQINLVICNTDESLPKAERYLKRLVASGIDGLIYMPVASDEQYERNRDLLMYIVNQGIPVVQLDRHIADMPASVASVAPDNLQGGFIIAQHLVGLGHRRIGFVGSTRCSSIDERRQGLLRCLESHGLKLDPADDFHAANDELIDQAAADLSRRRDDRPTALFVYTDGVASLLIARLRAYGLQVPRDIVVVGYDDHRDELSPESIGLTTMHVPLDEEGRAAAAMMCKLLDGQTPDPVNVRLRCDLVLRDSCGAAQRANSGLMATPPH